MRRVYLLRHAKSSWKDRSLADRDRPLAGRGKRAAKAVAGHLEAERIRPDLVLCSPARRTWETLELVVAAFGDRVEVQLRHLATHDPLTDLPNRRAFEHSLSRLVKRARRGGPHGALWLVDLGSLKQVNDRLGHLASDFLLIAVAKRLRETVRPGDLLARLR
jgi:GGDEF domain-containing protein